jgi:hypothetical protein
VLLTIIAAAMLSAMQTFTVSIPGGVDRVTFDPAKASEQDVRRWMQLSPELSPNNDYLVPESLELCTKDPEYKPCGSHDWRAENFVYNAKINLQRIQRRIQLLDDSAYPEDLGRVVTYLREVQRFWLWRETQRLRFYQTWDISKLEVPYGEIDPKHQCALVIEKIKAAGGPDAKYRLARHDWWNCVWDLQRVRLGTYPEKEWQEFLNRHAIREEFISNDD